MTKREGAERELRNLISQVQDYKQERSEHDAVQQRENTMIKSIDQKLEKSHKRQEQVWKDRANEQSSVASQTAQQRAANSAEETAKIDSSGYHSGSDRDSSSVRSAVMPDSGEATPHEYTPADNQEDQEGVDSGEQACVRLERRVETVYAYLCTMGTCWMKCVIMMAAMYRTLQPGSEKSTVCQIAHCKRNGNQLDYDMLRATCHVTCIKSKCSTWAK